MECQNYKKMPTYRCEILSTKNYMEVRKIKMSLWLIHVLISNNYHVMVGYFRLS